MAGIEAAPAEAVHNRFTQLRFGFTYAYCFSPSGDADLSAHLAAHGGRPFVRALGFVGLDFCPGTICLPRRAQGSAFRQLVQAAQAYSHTFNITDDRWFNLRDTTSAGPATRVGATFSSDGLLDDHYAPKAIVRRVSQLDRDIWPAQGHSPSTRCPILQQSPCEPQASPWPPRASGGTARTVATETPGPSTLQTGPGALR